MNFQTDKAAELFAERDQSDSPGAALAITKAGNTIYKRGYGSANLDYNVAITPESVFSPMAPVIAVAKPART